MQNFKNHIRYNLLNILKLDIINDEDLEPFAYITDESREEFSENLISYIADLLVNYNSFISDPNNSEKLTKHIESMGIDLTKSDDISVKDKIKIVLEFYLNNNS